MKKIIKTLTAFFILLVFFFLSLNSSIYASTVKDLSLSSDFNILYMGGGGAAGKITGDGNLKTCDLNNNGILDILAVSHGADYNNRSGSGSLYVVYDSLYTTYSGTGNSVDISQPENYSLRFDGAVAGDNIGHEALGCADIDGNGKNDILIGGYHADPEGRGHAGYLYVIYDSVFENANDTGTNFDLSASSSWNLRFDGAQAHDHIGEAVVVSDVDGNGRQDIILLGSTADYNGRTDSGAVWVIYDSIIDNYSGLGNVIDLSDTTNWNLRFEGAENNQSLGGYGLAVADVDDNGSKDFVIGAPKLSPIDGDIYVIYDSIFSSLASTGHTIDLNTTSNYNIKFTGPADSQIGRNIAVKDIDANGVVDILIANSFADYNGRTDSGSFYVIKDSLLDAFTGTNNNLDLSSSSSFSFRIDGGASSSYFGKDVISADINNNGQNDLIVGSQGEGSLVEGQLYYIFDEIYDSDTKTYDINNSSNYNFALKGPSLGFIGEKSSIVDLNQDDKSDTLVLLTNASGDYSVGGGFWIIYNFPHTISIDSVSKAGDTIITGSVLALNSVTNISMVQYSIDDNSFSGSWSNCTATDGSFGSTNENFSCTISSLSSDSHTIYIRAYDANASYTAQPNYATVVFNRASFAVDTASSANGVSFSIIAGSLADQVDTYSTYLDFTLSANSTVELRSYNRYLFTSSAANTDCSNASYSKLTLPAYSTQTTVRVTPTSDICPSSNGGGGGGGAPSNVPAPTPDPDPEPDPDPTPEPEGSTGMAKPEDYDLQEGDLIRAVGDLDIFIISGHGYKRLFLNPVIFNMYGHLGSWDDVKTVTPSTRDAFKTSNHYRYVGADKVYHIDITGADTAQLRWLNMTGETFMSQGGKAEGIFVINQAEFNWYEQGEDKISL